MKSVHGKVVLVTGAAMGMGRMFAERAVAQEARAVVLWDVNEAALDETADALSGHGTEVLVDVVDVSDLESVRTAAEWARGEVGDPQVVINNAGVVRGNHYFWETDSEADAFFTMRINALGPMYVARETLPGMIADGGECRLVNLASAAGLTTNPRMAVYAGSKWAVVGWSESVRLELEQAGHKHVRVTTVCPYYVKTGMFAGAKSAPLLPLLEPEQVIEETWKGMLAGESFIVMPRAVQLGEMMKGIVPLGVRDFFVGRILGIHHTMDDFTGRPGA